MQNSLLHTAFQTLTGDEIKAFRKFVSSPFFNQREDVVRLFEVLVECRKSKKPVLEKAALFHKIFPREKYDDRKMRHVMSFLLRLLEQFFTHSIQVENEGIAHTQLAEAYRRRGLTQHFQRTLQRVAEQHSKSSFHHADHYWLGYELQRQGYLLTASSNRVTALNFQQLGDQLDLAFLALKLRQSCLALSHQAVFKAEYDLGLLPQVLDEVQRRELLDQPAISVYFHCYHTLTEPNEEAHFQKFKSELYRHDGSFPTSESRDLYLLAINFCIRRYNEGEEKFLAEELELYQAALEKKLLLINGQLSRFTYQNAVTLGLVLREFDWVESFLRDYTAMLDPRFRTANHSFNLARLEYERGNFDKALELLQRADYQDLLLNLTAKTVLLKIYFETAEFDALDSHLDAMSNFVRRKKALSYHRDNYLNLCRFVRRLLVTLPSDDGAFHRLQEEVNQSPAVAERKWLLEKMEDVKKFK